MRTVLLVVLAMGCVDEPQPPNLYLDGPPTITMPAFERHIDANGRVLSCVPEEQVPQIQSMLDRATLWQLRALHALDKCCGWEPTAGEAPPANTDLP